MRCACFYRERYKIILSGCCKNKVKLDLAEAELDHAQQTRLQCESHEHSAALVPSSQDMLEAGNGALSPFRSSQTLDLLSHLKLLLISSTEPLLECSIHRHLITTIRNERVDDSLSTSSLDILSQCVVFMEISHNTLIFL